MTSSRPESGTRSLWVQCFCTALVALGAAYASYRHGREFALRFGADQSTASIWPLIVDGLLTMATVELWKPAHEKHLGGKWSAWVAFGFGISLSLCANIGAAPTLTVFSVAVAACPPLALLLAVELLNRALKRYRGNEKIEPAQQVGDREADACVSEQTPCLDQAAEEPETWSEAPAEQRMWAYYQAEQAAGRKPTGADLDRIAGTNNYGRRVLRRWRSEGRGHAGPIAIGGNPPPGSRMIAPENSVMVSTQPSR
jgi:hypothetical protein